MSISTAGAHVEEGQATSLSLFGGMKMIDISSIFEYRIMSGCSAGYDDILTIEKYKLDETKTKD